MRHLESRQRKTKGHRDRKWERRKRRRIYSKNSAEKGTKIMRGFRMKKGQIERVREINGVMFFPSSCLCLFLYICRHALSIGLYILLSLYVL